MDFYITLPIYPCYSVFIRVLNYNSRVARKKSHTEFLNLRVLNKLY